MKTIRSNRFFIAFLMAVAGLWGFCAPLHADEYRVQVDDVVHVQVMEEEGLTNSFVVAPDGKIPFPMIGMVAAENRSLGEIAHTIQERLAHGYLRYPEVTVSLEKRSDPKFFVYGEVKTPGVYALTSVPITVMQSIAMAGGLAKSGSESKISVMRPKQSGAGYDVMKVDVKKAITKGEGDPIIQARDIVLVREGWF